MLELSTRNMKKSLEYDAVSQEVESAREAEGLDESEDEQEQFSEEDYQQDEEEYEIYQEHVDMPDGDCKIM